MVHFTIGCSLFVSLVLVFVLFDASSSYASKVVQVHEICKQTDDPSFCSNLLNSKRGGAKGANLVTLAQYTIEIARANITNTISLIKKLIAQNSNNPKAKDYYNKCLTYFGEDSGALSSINYAQHLLKIKNYFDMQISATDVASCVIMCTSPADPYPDPSLLPTYGDLVGKVSGILVIIADYLMGN